MDSQLDSSFQCNETGCLKSYSGISGLNNHIKKKHSGTSVFPCDECPQIFKATQERTMHKLQEHEGRRYQTIRQKKMNTNSNSELCKSSTMANESNLEATSNTVTEYPCPECSKVFYTMNVFNEHRNFHDSNIPKQSCSVCGKEFLTQRKLKEHSIIHKERIIYKCNVCAKVFLRSQTLQYHRTICKAAFPCDECVDSFMTKDALEKHKILHKVKQFICTKCNKTFPNQQALMNHEKRHSVRMNYMCPICKDSVSTRANFEKHLKNHLETNLKCPICDISFKSLVKYGYHKAEIHKIYCMFDCPLCNDNFCTRHELFIHLHNHKDVNTSTNTYICNTCGHTFSIKEIYEEHIQSHSKDSKNDPSNEIESHESNVVAPLLSECNDDPTTVKNLKCDQCDKVFQFQSLLTHHRTKEHEVKRFPCTIGFCDQIYSTIDELNSHIKQHEYDKNEKLVENQTNEYSCSVNGCERTFEFQSKLKRHMLSHILKEYNCLKCDRIYYSTGIYEKHLKYCSTSQENLILDDEELNSGPIECYICQQLFENQRVLKYHRNFCKEENKNDVEIQEENNLNSTKIVEVYVESDLSTNFLSEL